MRKYGVEWIFGIFLVSVLLILAGCSGGGSSNKVDEVEIQKAVRERITVFKTAIETYNVDVMLGFLDQSSFELTIAEAGCSANKDYITLKEELEEDQPQQHQWRQDPPQGYGYVLVMDLDDFTYTNLSNSGVVVALSFVIREKAAEIAELVTDQGTIVFELVKKGNNWLCQNMTINFEAITPLSDNWLLEKAISRQGLGIGGQTL